MFEKILVFANISITSFRIDVAIVVFFSYVIVDALYARYTLEVVKLNEYKAATTGVIIHFLLAFGVISYIQNSLYIIPLVIGSWLGTFYSVRKSRLQHSIKQTN